MNVTNSEIITISMPDVKNVVTVDYSDDELIIADNIKIFPTITSATTDFNVGLQCITGKARMEINGHKVEITEKKIIICRSEIIVSDLMVSPDFECCITCISNRLLTQILQAQMPIWTKALYKTPYRIVEDKFGHLRINNEVRDTIKATKSPFQKEIIQCLLRAAALIMCEMLQDEETEQNSDFTHSDVIFQKFIENITKRKIKKTEIYVYANELCISAKYLSQLCIKISGKSASQWINQFVMDDVINYLKNTDLSMKEISDNLGFPNQSFFGKYVRKQVNISPAEYRKQLRGNKK